MRHTSPAAVTWESHRESAANRVWVRDSRVSSCEGAGRRQGGGGEGAGRGQREGVGGGGKANRSGNRDGVERLKG